MRRLSRRLKILLGSTSLALFLVLIPAEKAGAQFMGYGYGYPGYGYGYGGPGMGYGGGGWGGYGYGYPAMGYGGMGGGGYGYPAFGGAVVPAYGGYGMGYPGYTYGGLGYGGFGYVPGNIGLSGVGFWNPMFGVGLTPLGTQSFMTETRLLGRVPRVSNRYSTAAYGRRYVGTAYGGSSAGAVYRGPQ